ncbi:alpha/beta hydrolase [Schumannella luteola]|uniref:Acetyl esterase n=1 Tax=Schumannella luteola TaxID=472059 RepID=A0A852YB77_9MICO|nr:alpha/beta hydrolase [Schumannella luteola]NYG98451.1 acetyl esterase [Schumannella luteola]
MSFTKPRLDAFARAVDERLKPRAPAPGKTAQQRRANAEAFDPIMCAELGIGPVDLATEEHTLSVAGHPDARLRVYWPTTERPAATADGAAGLPILVYFFGGGFEIAGIDWVWWDASFRERARDAGVIVIAGEYSHAPERKFPTQAEQCWTVFEWAAEHARELGGDPERLAIGGGSAGGNLAAATLLMNRDRANRPVRLQLLEVPLLDLTGAHLKSQPGIPKLVFWQLARTLVTQYLGRDRALRRNPYASPLRAESFAGLPPAVIYTAELDALRGDGEAYARALSEAGVPVSCVRMIGQNHGSAGYRHAVPMSDHQHRDIVATLRTLHDDPVVYPQIGAAL